MNFPFELLIILTILLLTTIFLMIILIKLILTIILERAVMAATIYKNNILFEEIKEDIEKFNERASELMIATINKDENKI